MRLKSMLLGRGRGLSGRWGLLGGALCLTGLLVLLLSDLPSLLLLPALGCLLHGPGPLLLLPLRALLPLG